MTINDNLGIDPAYQVCPGCGRCPTCGHYPNPKGYPSLPLPLPLPPVVGDPVYPSPYIGDFPPSTTMPSWQPFWPWQIYNTSHT